MVGATGSKYTYDAENRLISVEPQIVSSGTTKVECSYDYMGRRVEKKVFTYTSGSWILTSDSFFIYDGWNMVQELSSVVGQPSSIKSYIYGQDLSQSLQGAGGIGGLLAVIDSGETYHYFYDGNGNVTQLVKASGGSIAAHYEYDPYGNATVKSGLIADDNTIRFSSKYFDNETGLLYYGYRFYSPALGRWINRDPKGEAGGLNLYGFVGNNPVNYFDPKGFQAYREADPIEEREEHYVRGIPQRWQPFEPSPSNPNGRAPGDDEPGPGEETETVMREFCDAVCCDFDPCTGKCKGNGPWLVSAGTNCPCIKSHWEPILLRRGKPPLRLNQSGPWNINWWPFNRIIKYVRGY
jgi:RHS repeat-associated protein